MKKIEIIFGLIRLPIDFIMSFVALITAYFLRKTPLVSKFLSQVDQQFLNVFDSFLIYSLILSAVMVFLLSFYRLYALRISDGIWKEVRKIFLASIVWLMLIVTYFFLKRDLPFSRSVILFATALQFLALSLGRIFIHKLQQAYLKKGYGVRKVVLIGDNPYLLGKVYKFFLQDPAYQVLGYLSSVGVPAKYIPSKLKLGNYSVLEKIFQEYNFDDIIHSGRFEKDLSSEELLGLCKVYHRDYQFLPDIFSLQERNIHLDKLNNLPIFRLKRTSLDGWPRVIKRAFDILVSLFLLIILSPLFLLVSILIKLESEGPVFFSKNDEGDYLYRAGIEQKPFVCMKFRSMKINTHSQRYNELSAQDIHEGASPLVKIKADPRVTKVGKFIRRFDIDELPQLWNVLKGEMSLVGPRPHLSEEIKKYKKHQHFVFTIKPGITGMAQVNGRSDLAFEDEIALDSYYIENWSLWLDVKIILKTVLVVFQGHGENNA